MGTLVFFSIRLSGKDLLCLRQSRPQALGSFRDLVVVSKLPPELLHLVIGLGKAKEPEMIMR
jgi:hypothetical protein